ncbi:hypothetical protein M4D56_02045 [Cytobacillus oceanisediminis]|uniref:hypothetical protein n=1 Tax=Cytobacillus oceanisediminis TaxID=665099 RepID=UPI00203E93B8|nr:hypothetical protein [Cytobacillus oceanisediminis]MCM3527877.1 hypothetical protein [Cytobacillus oceanisediminis]
MDAMKRTDLIGIEGAITKNFTIVDAVEYPSVGTVDVRVADSTGEEYWVSLEDIELEK